MKLEEVQKGSPPFLAVSHEAGKRAFQAPRSSGKSAKIVSFSPKIQIPRGSELVSRSRWRLGKARLESLGNSKARLQRRSNKKNLLKFCPGKKARSPFFAQESPKSP